MLDGQPQRDGTADAEAEEVDLLQPEVIEQPDHVRGQASVASGRSMSLVRP